MTEAYPARLTLTRGLFGFRRLVLACLVFTIVTLTLTDHAEANSSARSRAENPDKITLTAQPETCVALSKGQICYAHIRLDWYGLAEGHYCLELTNPARELICWQGTGPTQHSFYYASSTSQQAQLVHKIDGRVMAVVLISTAWVYRGSRRSNSGWRLF